ncbi:hypothetical protein ACQUZQ_08610 [Aeromonas veronii]|uniref:hypothetical protein n=1 Tax=Aeromonas veronii TaxID=654 RepID=UPI003D1C566E
MKYTVLASLADDINSGWCWIKGSEVKSRKLVKITNLSNGKYIICEGLFIDKNFENKYHENIKNKRNIELLNNQKVILINLWYREILGIHNTQENYNIDVSLVSRYSFLKRIKACLMHPQVSIRISTVLGVAGVVLGVVSLINEQPCKLIAVSLISFLIGKINMTRAWDK